jgi:hypothetical protein
MQRWTAFVRHGRRQLSRKHSEYGNKSIGAIRIIWQRFRINEHLKHENLLKEDEIKEGEELKRLANQYDVEKAKLDEIKAAEAKQLLDDNRRQIADVQRMREYNRIQEEVNSCF